MLGRFDLPVSASADDRAERDQELHEDRDRIALGEGKDRFDQLAGNTLVGRCLRRLGPSLATGINGARLNRLDSICEIEDGRDNLFGILSFLDALKHPQKSAEGRALS